MSKYLGTSYFNPDRGASIPKVDAAYTRLEQTGFMVDVPYLNSQARVAREDERQQLEELRTLSAGLTSENPDSIWSSPKQFIKLFHDDLKLEPSPIWKKGEVARWKGEIKTDSVAVEYLANANPEYRPILKGILHLKRIRSSLKYLGKLPRFVQSDGLIHPVYGAGSDNDESSGTNSGRTVMKNPEGQQIPAGEEKDPYNIRKAFIAPPGQVLVVRDYSAMEAVILHSICLKLFNDSSLAEANEPHFHGENARIVFGDYLKWKHPSGKPISDFSLDSFKTDGYLKDRRKDAKTVFYGLQFCKGKRGFGWSLLDDEGNPIGEGLAGSIVDAFNSVRPGIGKFQQYVFEELLRQQVFSNQRDRICGIPDLSGRVRNVRDLLEPSRGATPDWRFRKAWRQSCNHVCQGGGANVKSTALVQAIEAGLIVQNDIHDELIVRCHERDADRVNEQLKYFMEETYPLPAGVKLKTSGSIGMNWYEAK